MKRIFSLVLVLVLCLGLVFPVSAASASDALTETAKLLQKTPLQFGSSGGEWAAMGLARGGYTVSSGYYNQVVSHVKHCKGVLHERKYSEYSRVILALTAIGKDPTNVGGYDLTAPLEDFDQTIWQGINGAIYALLALDSGDYACDARQDYVDHLMRLEISGGGWALTGETADVDITAMVLQALAKYQDQPKVKQAVNRGISWLSKQQNANGTFSTMGTATCESTAQVLVALGELGISAEDRRFTKNGNSAMDGLLTFYSKGKGFRHVPDGSVDAIATEQAFYALVSAKRASEGQSSLYTMSSGSVSAAEAAFADIAGHKNQIAIEKLVEQKIINGMGGGKFAPNQTMTRAQYCTIVVKALGLTPKASGKFTDVAASAWYAGYVGTANGAGIVTGIGNNKFNPEGTITRQEAATMVARAAKTLGLETGVENADEILALFPDGGKVASYARDAMAYCYESGILEEGSTIQPTRAILRCEIAQMIYNMLKQAGKI